MTSHAQAAIDVRFGLGRKLRTFHAEVGSATLANNAGFLAGRLDDPGEFSADGIGKGDMRYHAATEKSVDPMAGAVEELIGDNEIQRLMLFFQRSDRGNGNDALDAELLEAMNVGAEVQFTGQDAVASPVARQECDLAAFERAADIGIRRRAKRRLQLALPSFWSVPAWSRARCRR